MKKRNTPAELSHIDKGGLKWSTVLHPPKKIMRTHREDLENLKIIEDKLIQMIRESFEQCRDVITSLENRCETEIETAVFWEKKYLDQKKEK